MNKKLIDRLMQAMAAAGNSPLEPLRDAMVVAAGQGFDLAYGLKTWRSKAETIHPLSRLIAAQVGDPLQQWDITNLSAFRGEFEQMLNYLPKRVVSAWEDCTIESNGIEFKVRTFRPNAVKRRTKIIYLHGGGFVLGNFDSNDPECDRIARGTGCEVLSIGYPLSPEYKCPTAMEAIIYVLTSSGLTKDDPIVMIGESAGANLALSILQNSPVVSKKCVGLILVYPYLDLTLSGESADQYGVGYFLTAGLLKWFAECYIGAGVKASDPQVSPLFGDMNNLPPSLAIVGEFDPLRSDAVRFAERHSGTRLEVFAGMIHGFLQLRGLSPARNRALKVIINFVDSL